MGALLALVLATSVAEASPKTGTISGKVTVTNENGDPANSAVVVVYVIGPPMTAPPRDAKPAVLAMEKRAFVPDLLAIAEGGSVEFPNRDRSTHSPFSPPNKSLDLGLLRHQDTAPTRRFEKHGIHHLICAIHEYEHAMILVLPNRHYTSTTTGAFELTDVPIGDWTVYAFTRLAEKPASVAVKVAANRATVDLALTQIADHAHFKKYRRPMFKRRHD